MTQMKLPADGKLDGKLAEGHLENEKARIDQGVIGKFFGSKNSAPTNIAAVIAIICLCALVLTVFIPSNDSSFPTKDRVATFSSIITLVVGYLFGRALDN